MKRISKRLIASGALDVVATAVPGMKDILVLGKVKSLDETRAADLIIVDAPAAGHAISFLLSPRGLLDAVRVGPISKQAADVVALLSDPARCQVMLVTLPEETPVSEVIETAFAIEDRAGVALGPVVVNQCFEPLPVGVTASRRRRARRRRGVRALRLANARRTTSRARPRSAPSGTRCNTSRSSGSARELPLPQIELPFVFTPDIGRAAGRRARRRARRAGSSGCDDRASGSRTRRRSSASSICCGSGGVGKTTTAAVLALEGARAGPQHVRGHDRSRQAARRRARPRSSSPTRPSAIDRERWDDDGSATPDGALSAMMLDTKSTFDQLVTGERGDRRAGAAHPRQSLLPQRLRRARRHAGIHGDGEAARAARRTATSTSSSSTRRRRATRSTSSTRPAGLLRLLDNRIFRMLMMPTRAYLRVASVAVQTFLRTVARVVGSEVIDDVVAFFRAFEGMEDGFRDRALAVEALLAAPETGVRARHLAAARRDGGGAVLRATARAERPDDRGARS